VQPRFWKSQPELYLRRLAVITSAPWAICELMQIPPPSISCQATRSYEPPINWGLLSSVPTTWYMVRPMYTERIYSGPAVGGTTNDPISAGRLESPVPGSPTWFRCVRGREGSGGARDPTWEGRNSEVDEQPRGRGSTKSGQPIERRCTMGDDE